MYKRPRNFSDPILSSAHSGKRRSLLVEKVESAEISASWKSRPQLKLCAHCGERLSKKTWRKHYRTYYNSCKRTWITSANASVTDEQSMK